MTIKQALEKLKNDFDFRIRSYSGRGMYGKICLGVVTKDDPLQFMCALGAFVGDCYDLDDALGVQQDSMGRDTILYWPGMTFEDEDLDDLDDEETL